MSLNKGFIGYLLVAVVSCVLAAYFLSLYYTAGMQGVSDTMSLFLCLTFFLLSVVTLVLALKKTQ